MLQLEPVNTRGVCMLNIKIIRVIVILVSDSYPEGSRIAKLAKVDAIHRQVLVVFRFATHFQRCINLGQLRPKFHHHLLWIHHRQPECFFPLGVFIRHRSREAQQVIINQGDFGIPSKVIQILAKPCRSFIMGLLAGNHRRNSDSPAPRHQMESRKLTASIKQNHEAPLDTADYKALLVLGFS